MDESRGNVVVAVGSANADVTFRVPHLVAPGETLSATEVALHSGGKCANQTVAAARLGARSRLVGAVGDDSNGGFLLRELAAAGVDTDAVAVLENVPTGTAYICVDDRGENTIVLSAGANGALHAGMLRAEHFADARVVTLCYEVDPALVAAAARRGKDAGATVIVNASPVEAAVSADGVASIAQVADILVVNESELATLTGCDVTDQGLLAARRVLGVATLVVTLGSHGAAAVRHGAMAASDDAAAASERDAADPDRGYGVVRVPGVPVTPVDTTGCGDAFLGALAWAIADGADLADALRRANAVGALAATREGAQSSYPTLEELTTAAF
jgi:ribokinase